jgi:hypothetical protein
VEPDIPDKPDKPDKQGRLSQAGRQPQAGMQGMQEPVGTPDTLAEEGSHPSLPASNTRNHSKLYR